jgi:hypothetical protein
MDVFSQMTNITAKSVPCDAPLLEDLEIVSVEYSANSLRINTRSLSDSASAVVEFPDTTGFRVLDEGNLLEFWPECSSANGRFFRNLCWRMAGSRVDSTWQPLWTDENKS